MRPHETTSPAHPGRSAHPFLLDGTRDPPPYERAAYATALDDGLMPDEVSRILAGRRIAEVFPVRWGESPEAYASRAVSEMFVAYLQ